MNKLKNENGVTILMALLLLLAATVVSVVILTAAATAARHLENDRALQQSYLTVSSAAELIRDDILSSQFQEETTTRRPSATSAPIVSTKQLQAPSGLMADWLCAARTSVERNLPFSSSAVLSVGTDSGLADVQMTFTMDTDWHIKVTFSLSDGGEDDCRLTLTLSGDKNVETKTVTGSETEAGQDTVTTTTITWSSAHIGKGAG